MITKDDIQGVLSGGTVVDSDGEKIGKVGQIYLDDQTGEPEWVTVSTGMFGSSESFIPLADAGVSGDQVRVPFSKDKVKDAPRVDSDGSIDESQEAELYSYYGMGYSESESDSGRPTGTTGVATNTTTDHDRRDGVDVDTGTEGYDTSGPTTDNAMTRSEERLRVGKEQVESGRARLRKYVVTEEEQVSVPVSREEVRLEREPITDANRGDAMAGGDITEEEHEVVLTEERAVIAKETVPVERVRLGTETVTEEQQVSETIRKEQIETDGIETTGVERNERVDVDQDDESLVDKAKRKL